MEKVVIKTENLWHVYHPDIVALRGMDLQIREKELLAFIGQNGGGKTTLAKHFNGLLKPTKGKVFVKGMDTEKASMGELVPIVGYVFQNPKHQLFSKTVYDEVAFGPRNLKLPKEEIEGRVKGALSEVGLWECRDIHPYDVDYTKMKLLTIASVISLKPEIYVLDEPTTGQDHRGWRVLEKLVTRLNKEATVIFITHDMRFVAEVADRVVLIANGKIIADGSTREIFQQRELLEKAQIKPPQVAQLSHALNPYGVPESLIKIDEMGRFLGTKLKNLSIEG